MRRSSQRQRIVIVGGGFAGLQAARELSCRHAVTLIDPKAHFDFLPNIHEIVSRVKSPAAVRIPFEKVLRQYDHRFHRARTMAIDPHHKQVRTSAGKTFSYDVLVVAVGSEVSDHVPHAGNLLPLHSSSQAKTIRNRLRQLDDDAGRFRVTIVGGGYVGVECLGEILRRYRRNRKLSVNVVESQKRLVQNLPKRVHRRVLEILDDFDVTVLTRERVAEVTDDKVILRSGRSFRSDVTIWTAGTKPAKLLAESGLAEIGAYASVKDTLQSRQYDDIFVIGDAAETREEIGKQAYHAIDMGKLAAKNVDRFISGSRLKRYEPRREQFLISFGYLSCFYVADDLVVESSALTAAREAIFQQGMLEFEDAFHPRAQRRAWQRLADFGFNQSLDVARTFIPIPFPCPRDGYDLPRFPRFGR